ncbi:biotin transporter BioY [Halalkalibacter hemicellulosilyticus]|uniref:Biotin transporter n=1 Tax=Halalkalibacter hemicellulosilyticusJCM 9152 TaxID=1236971 RepID=W4QG60_9BACI|nr:biotin transporter BioY [Halalkalibacter hemicellulosilyticus]GAE30329.1 substrate-specific component BioY of biotin ECF transporter [Halalkalibacter hemicellulosilyticusJCM 9152]
MIKQTFQTRQIVYVALFAALMTIGANVTSFLVIGSVPITLQPFFAMLAGALLGKRLGSISMIVYIVVGLVGFPVFAQFRGGFSTFVSPTFGFLLSFIILAFVAGWIIEKSKEKNISTFFIACFVGLLINYLLGTNYMYVNLNLLADGEAVSYGTVWAWMAAPFVKDFIFTCFAAILAKRVYHMVQLSNPTSRSKAA